MALTLKFSEGDSPNLVNCSAPGKFCSACGGIPPYTWKILAKGIGFITPQVVSTTQIRIPAPTNPGSGIAGIAFSRISLTVIATGLCNSNGGVRANWNCAGIRVADTNVSGICSVSALAACNGTAPQYVDCTCNINCDDDGFGGPQGVLYTTLPGVKGEFLFGFKDLRSGPMIAGSCLPCAISLRGAIVTVTDSTGVSVSRSLGD